MINDSTIPKMRFFFPLFLFIHLLFRFLWHILHTLATIKFSILFDSLLDPNWLLDERLKTSCCRVTTATEYPHYFAQLSVIVNLDTEKTGSIFLSKILLCKKLSEQMRIIWWPYYCHVIFIYFWRSRYSVSYRYTIAIYCCCNANMLSHLFTTSFRLCYYPSALPYHSIFQYFDDDHPILLKVYIRFIRCMIDDQAILKQFVFTTAFLQVYFVRYITR